MSWIGKPSLATLAACLLAAGGVIAIGVAVWADLDPGERDALAQIMPSRLPLIALIAFALCGAFGWMVHTLYARRVARLARMAEDARVMLGTRAGRRLDPHEVAEAAALAHVVNEFADERDALQLDVDDRIRTAQASLEEERNRLAALMSELQQSVVVCNLDGVILLYNTRARLQFQALAAGTDGGTHAAPAAVGLGRSIFTIIERNLITHALENIRLRSKRGVQQPGASFLTATRAGQLLRVRMAPVLTGAARSAHHDDRGRPEAERESERADERNIGGYVLMLDNITRDFERETRRDQMLQALTEGSRASLANIRAAIETLHGYPDMEVWERDGFIEIVGEEVRSLSQRLDHTMAEHADSMKARWPLEEMLGTDLIAAAQRRIEARIGMRTRTEALEQTLWVKVDSFSLLQGLVYLAHRLHEDFDIREVRFRLAQSGRMAHLDMLWAGTHVALETLHEWEMEPMSIGTETTLLTLRDVVERHGGEFWYQRETARQIGFCRLLLPAAMPQEVMPASALLHSGSRPDYYDFDLFKELATSHALDDRLLSELTYTVFDTETTGLDPDGGDEIIQIGAARILNGRLLRNEHFDQLVDPRRPLSPASIGIHGITEDMLEGGRTIEQVLPAFHAFCADTVLVGHNAAFDMRFLQLKETSAGVTFSQPVLDTLLLSPVIHPNQESHKLEAIAERFGVAVVGRHSAMGDTMVTAEIFLKMIPLLAQMGIRTLRQAREASEKTYYARAKY